MLQEIYSHEPLIFKSSFNFDQKHLLAAQEILSSANQNSHIEIGDAYSSVANQQNAPHFHTDFFEYFQWQNSTALNIILERFKLASDLEYSIGNSWVNLHNRGGQTQAHCHGASVLSCVGYISAESGTGNIEFKDPYFDLRSLHERSDGDLGLKEWTEIPVKTGDVLFFPGWMQHRSQANLTDTPRWIVSSNYVNFVLKRPLTLGNIAKFS